MDVRYKTVGHNGPINCNVVTYIRGCPWIYKQQFGCLLLHRLTFGVMSAEYSYDLFDDGADCEHDGELVYGKILRRKENGKTQCVDGRRFFKRLPPKPDSHPIIPELLTRWKDTTLTTLEGLRGDNGNTDILRDKLIEKLKSDVIFFYENLVHVSHEAFVAALKSCCDVFDDMYPSTDFVKISTTALNSEKSDRWVEDVAIYEGFLKIPERGVANQPSKKKRKQVKFKIEDGMYSGMQFAEAMEEDVMKVYICPFISGGDFLMDPNRRREIVEIVERLYRKYNDVYKIYFIRSMDKQVTHVVEGVEWDVMDEQYGQPEWKVTKNTRNLDLDKDEPSDHTIRFIYHSLMEKDGMAVPFYFDHKLADQTSWDREPDDMDDTNMSEDTNMSWMFAGFHAPWPKALRHYSGDAARALSSTNFIKGCEAETQGNMESFPSSEFEIERKCPSRLPWKLEEV